MSNQNKLTLVEGTLVKDTLTLDDIVGCFSEDECEKEISLIIQKKNNKYGILSFKFKEEDKDITSNVKVFNAEGNEVNIFI